MNKRVNEQFTKKTQQFAHLSWVTWANGSQSLFCYEQPELYTHGWSFDMSDSLTVAHLSWAIWGNERWVNSQPWCTQCSLTRWWDAHGRAWEIWVTWLQGWAYVLFKRTQRSFVLLHSFQKNETFLRSFEFFIKRMKRSLRSFMFFIKECSILCVLLSSL